jgi:hypothetical protein
VRSSLLDFELREKVVLGWSAMVEHSVSIFADLLPELRYEPRKSA